MHNLSRQFKQTGLKKCVSLKKQVAEDVLEHGLVSRGFFPVVWLRPLCTDSSLC